MWDGYISQPAGRHFHNAKSSICRRIPPKKKFHLNCYLLDYKTPLKIQYGKEVGELSNIYSYPQIIKSNIWDEKVLNENGIGLVFLPQLVNSEGIV